MSGYEEFQQIMAEINRKKQLEELRKKGMNSGMGDFLSNLFGGNNPFNV